MKQVEERYISFEASKMAYRDIKNSIDTAKREGKEEGLAEGMEKGLAEGMKKGLAEGVEKGLAEGMEKGMNKRSLEIARKMLAKWYGCSHGDGNNRIVGESVTAAERIRNCLEKQMISVAASVADEVSLDR